MSLGVDAAVPRNLLLQETSREGVGFYARMVEDVYFSRREEDRLRRAGGESSQEVGDWTRFLGGDGPQNLGEQDADGLQRQASAFLAPLVPALEEISHRRDRYSLRALDVLGRVRIPGSLLAIEEASKLRGLKGPAIAALSTLGGPRAAEIALRILKESTSEEEFPRWIFALRSLATPETRALLGDLTQSPATESDVASALEGFEAFEPEPLLDALMRSGRPWTLMQALETMGRLGGDVQVQRLRQVYQGIQHPLVRVACLRALAQTQSRAAGELALAALKEKDPNLKAAAVEALIQLPVPRKAYRTPVLQLIENPHPKLAMNVALACMVLDPDRGAARIGQLLRSGSAPHLLQGVHCLAYLESPKAARTLKNIVLRSPPGPIQIQGIRSLGRRALRNPQATPDLLALLQSESPDVRVTAAWFASGCHPAARQVAAQHLGETLQREKVPAVQATLAEALAYLGPAGMHAAPTLVQVLDGPHPVAKSAAWALATAFRDSPEAGSLLSHSRSEVRCYGILREWLAQGTSLDGLVPLLGKSEETVLDAALEVARLAAESASLLGSQLKLLGGLETQLSTALARSSADFRLRPLPDVVSSRRTGQRLPKVQLPRPMPEGKPVSQADLPSPEELEEVVKNTTSLQAVEAVEQASYFQPEQNTAKTPQVTPALGAAPDASSEPLAQAPAAAPVGVPSSQRETLRSRVDQLPGRDQPPREPSQAQATKLQPAPQPGQDLWKERMLLVLEAVKLIVFLGLAMLLGSALRQLVDRYL